MKYRAFIDTNAVWDDRGSFGTLFSPSFTDLPDFLKKNSVSNVTVCFPEVVIRERIQHKKEKIDLVLKTINERIRSLQEVGHDELELITARNDYEEKLRVLAEVFCKTNNIEIVSTPTPSVEELVNWAIKKEKPFNDHGSGFKDTLIYLSMVQDALEKKGDVYVLCTNNTSQFDEDIINDFKRRTEKVLYIIPDIVGVQQKLDELIPLKLHLETRNSEVKKIIELYVGDIMKAINTEKPSRLRTSYRYGDSTANWQIRQNLWVGGISGREENKHEIVGYNFKDINFLGFEEILDKKIQARVNISTNITYKDEIRDSEDESYYNYNGTLNRYSNVTRNVFVHNSDLIYQKYRPGRKDFEVVIDCEMGTKTISINEVTSGLEY